MAVPSGVKALAIGAETTRAYATTGDGNLLYWDLVGNSIVETIQVGKNPVAISIGMVPPTSGSSPAAGTANGASSTGGATVGTGGTGGTAAPGGAAGTAGTTGIGGYRTNGTTSAVGTTSTTRHNWHWRTTAPTAQHPPWGRPAPAAQLALAAPRTNGTTPAGRHDWHQRGHHRPGGASSGHRDRARRAA
jgi:hypothetical protein